MPYQVVDPVKKTPLENLWNLWGMGHNRNELVIVLYNSKMYVTRA